MPVPKPTPSWKGSLKEIRDAIFNKTTYRGIIAIVLAILFWETAARLDFPVIGKIPAPSSVIASLNALVRDAYYWESWLASFKRVFLGFIVAQIVGIPLGLLMGIRRYFRDLTFPIANVPPQGGRKHPHQEFTPVDTTNILFICGGAFVGLDKIISRRIGKKSLGFRSGEDAEKEDTFTSKKKSQELLQEVQPEDLIKFGLIPEFVGRLPVVGMLEDLDEFALIEILTRPKNAIVKQYQRLFEFENVRLKFADEALRAIARQAMARKVGARGLRMILEELMLDLMFNLPSQKKLKEFEVTREMVEKRSASFATVMEKAG